MNTITGGIGLKTLSDWDESLDVLRSIFPEMVRHQVHKCKTLFSEAIGQEVIVEIGVFHGMGTIALALGSGSAIYCVDDFKERFGWASEPYGPWDKDKFFENVKRAGVDVRLIRSESKLAAMSWPHKMIDLIHWDLGMPNKLETDFWAWATYVRGTMLIHDTADGRLGSQDLGVKLEDLGEGMWAYRR